MAYGLHRFNERHQRPNALINFIKPLEGPDKELAQDFLERVAAVVYPVMKAHTISVMSLDEFQANREFVGRNFNAGECIQLVLKSTTGQWLSFKSVQMVMMHELAHCKQMNHSRQFWAVRNTYADHLRILWSGNYSGEGVWGRGQTLLSGRFTNDNQPDVAPAVENLCGGAYRGRGRKRKRGGSSDAIQLTYAERQQRRIQRKFGKHGQGNAVGQDYLVKAKLEKGRTTDAKPRVANSNRGRELRAAAALARFEESAADKAAEVASSTASVAESGRDDTDETESEYESGGEELLDDHGQQVKDSAGHGLVKVCESEDALDEDVRREMEDLRMLDERPKTNSQGASQHKADSVKVAQDEELIQDNISTDDEAEPVVVNTAKESTSGIKCVICSLENDAQGATCIACAHVLDRRKVADAWHCANAECSREYLNADDCGVCGVCGTARPA